MATTQTTRIVNLSTTVTRAPTPSQLQQSGAFISVGGTNLATDSLTYCGALDAVQSLLSTTGNYAELDHMATTFFAQGQSIGAYVLELGDITTGVDDQITALQDWITGNPDQIYAYLCPAAWDYSKDEVGSVTMTSGGSGYTSAPSVTFSAPASGTTASGTATVQNGAVVAVTVTDPGQGYTSAPTVSFSGGGGSGAAATANLASALNIIANNYSSPSGKTYFFVTTSSVNLPNYSTLKSVFALVPAPTAPSTEFTAAMPFYQWLVNNPSAAAPLAPMAYRWAYGVTAWATTGTSLQTTPILSGYGNIIYTGAEGGISTAALFKGTLMDGEQAAWWYGVDWFQIQVKQALAAAILNGSNTNPPLLYNQAGINTLQKVAQNIGNSAVKFGCALSVVVNATSFTDYTTANPNDYNAGIYNGLSATLVGPSGFLTITFNLDAVQFVA